MRIAYFIRNIGVSGGVKVVLQHVQMLKEDGYDVTLFTNKVKDSWDLKEKPVIMKPDDLRDLSGFDIIVASIYHDVRMLFSKGARKLVHLCQGYEPIDYLSRIAGESVTERYQRKGFLSLLESRLDLLKFKEGYVRLKRSTLSPHSKLLCQNILCNSLRTSTVRDAHLSRMESISMFFVRPLREYGEPTEGYAFCQWVLQMWDSKVLLIPLMPWSS